MGTARLRSERPDAGRTGIARQVLVVLTLTVAGALISVGVVQARGSEYEATARVRAPTADATCQYFVCTPPVPTSSGNPYVLDQVNLIESQTLAARVRRSLNGFSGSSADLKSDVSAKEVGSSPTIEIRYTASSKSNASVIVKAYARQYVAWSNDQAVASLSDLEAQLTDEWNAIVAQGSDFANSTRGTAIYSALQGVKNAIVSYQEATQALQSGGATGISGPNGARVYDQDFDASSTRTTPSTLKTAGLGALAGLVLGMGLVLLLPSLGGGRQEDPLEVGLQRELVPRDVDEPIDEPVR